MMNDNPTLPRECAFAFFGTSFVVIKDPQLLPTGQSAFRGSAVGLRLRIVEADESLDVLSRTSKEELFANKLDARNRRRRSPI